MEQTERARAALAIPAFPGRTVGAACALTCVAADNPSGGSLRSQLLEGLQLNFGVRATQHSEAMHSDAEESVLSVLSVLSASARSSLPPAVRAAAIVFAVYGTFVLVHATVWQVLGDWAEAGQYPRALIRFAGMGLVAWGLRTAQRWAWWLGVLLGGWFLVAGLGLLLVAVRLGAGTLPLPLLALAGAAVAFVLLATGVGLLLLPSSRAALLRRAS